MFLTFLSYAIIFLICSSGVCAIYNPVLQLYYTIGIIWIFFTILPLVTIIVFGVLAYRNMRLLRNTAHLQSSDRQLILMISGQVILVIISVGVFGVFNAYSVATASANKSIEQRYIEAFVALVVNVINGIGISVSKFLFSLSLMFSSTTFGFQTGFYLFFAVSKKFRHECKRLLCFCCSNPNAVVPFNTSGQVRRTAID